MDQIFDIFLLEAVLNGLLLGGLLALLSLGLNLIFGVIDVVWICYAELIMVGMYAIWWLHSAQGVPLPFAFPIAIAFVAVLGALILWAVAINRLREVRIAKLQARGAGV